MTEQELVQLRHNSDTFQAAIGKAPKTTNNALGSGFYDPPHARWWVEADIRPEAIHLTIHSLTAEQVGQLLHVLQHLPDHEAQDAEQHAEQLPLLAIAT